MSVREIVGELARFRVVEDMVQNIARSPLTPDLKDLCQLVYLIVLEYDGDKKVVVGNGINDRKMAEEILE